MRRRNLLTFVPMCIRVVGSGAVVRLETEVVGLEVENCGGGQIVGA